MKWERTPLNVASSFGNNADPNLVLTTLLTFILCFIVVVGLFILFACASCELFRKAGIKKCWKALIPVYNLFLLCKLTWDVVVFWVYFALGLLATLSYILGLFVCKYCFIIFWGLCIIASLLYLVTIYKVCKSFGHGVGWTVGMIFLTPIFFPMLAFGKSKYTKLKKVTHDTK